MTLDANAFANLKANMKDSMSSHDCARLAMQVESDEEEESCKQISRTRLPTAPDTAPEMPLLPGNGRLDEALLSLGGAAHLIPLLVEQFRHDPPVDCGRRPHLAGQFHTQKSTYGSKVFSADAIYRLLGHAQEWWKNTPNVFRIQVPPGVRLIILGDTHGQLEDVLWIFWKYGLPSKTNRYLVDGDIVDRGGHGLDILLLLFAFKRDEEDSVQILRGNHEDTTTASMYGFKAELESKFGHGGPGGWLFHWITHEVMPFFPLGALLSDHPQQMVMFVVHGGIPVRNPGQMGPISIEGQIQQLNRFVPTVQVKETYEDYLLFGLLWADPAKPGQALRNESGRGNPFQEQETQEFCRINQVSCIIRAHQPPANLRGYEYLHSRRCITVFSASNYTGTLGNNGGVLVCDGDTLAMIGPQPSEHWAPSWAQLGELFEMHNPSKVSMADRAQITIQLEGHMDQNGQSHDSQPSAREPGGNALQQVEGRAIHMILKHKQDLYRAFGQMDPQFVGYIHLQSLLQILERTTGMTGCWAAMVKEWNLGQSVDYVQFLHRFQIVTELYGRAGSTHVDVFSAMSRLQVQISDVQADILVQGLDQDLSGRVDLDEFNRFLQMNHLQIPPWQTAALFEAMTVACARGPTVEDVLLALALVSTRNESSPASAAWSSAAKTIGEHIASSGQSFVAFFRKWDINKDGYLELPELVQALKTDVPAVGARFNDEQFEVLVKYMDSLGVQNDRVSLVEFLRAVGPANVAKILQSYLLEELLKPVYFHKPMLTSFLNRCDSSSSSMVPVDKFRLGILEMSRLLISNGEPPLTDCRVNAICEIASGGKEVVKYTDFLQSMKAADMHKRTALANLGLLGLTAALG